MRTATRTVLLGRIARAHEALRKLRDGLAANGYGAKAGEVEGACERLRDWEIGVREDIAMDHSGSTAGAPHSLPEVIAESEAHKALRRQTVGEACEHMQEGGR